jgi:eukaryotic-like serine/threonine-protein kinase
MEYDDPLFDKARASLRASDDAHSDLKPGTVIANRFVVDEIIARGAIGAVYKARQLGIDRDVAVKVLRHRISKHSNDVERLRREAVAAGQLRHPNIVTVFDFGALDDGRDYLAMEYLAGPTLADWIETRGATPPDMAATILIPVCDAVDASHAAGIVHRDLKPANIILPLAEDRDGLVKVVDFGLARLVEIESTLTGEAVVGTPAYLAPEVISGLTANKCSDVYSLGVISFEVLTGRAVFSGATSQGVLLQHLSKNPPRPSDVVGSLSNTVDQVILKALDKNPGNRYPSARDLGVALRGALNPETVETPTWAAHDEAPSRRAVAPNQPSVLVVDDDEGSLRLMQAILRQNKYNVTLAADGIDALLLLGSRAFDIILSDVTMPNLDGFALLEMMSKKGIVTPVIFLTGHENDQDEVRGFELGAVDYIRKPISPGVLAARVKKALQR